MTKIYLAILVFLNFSVGYSQKTYATTFEELPLKMAKEPKPILIKMYTAWCAVCKLQDRQIEKDNQLQKLLSDKYYYIEFNAESREAVLFNGREYIFLPNGKGGLHALANAFSEAKGSYPSWILLSPDYKLLSGYNGLLKSKDLIRVLSP